MASPAPVVWLLTDKKPGHRNQLKGLGNRLRVLAGASVSEVDATEYSIPLWRALLGMAPAMDGTLPPPDLIIAAGSGTHRLLLSLRRRSKAKTVVLMKPGFPIGWVDAAIIPEHDAVAPARHILTTEGVINAITPLARITDKPEGLILTGGPSPHYDWDDDVMLEQISQLMGRYPEWRWTISGSRRTPAALLKKLQELAGPKVTVVDPERTHSSWLPHQLAASRAVWVTPDSGSMVCEAATSGVPTGVFELAPRHNSRVARGMASLVEKGYVARWSDHASVMAGKLPESPGLWEADRAARWLISHFLKRGNH
ncbi:MAG: mitochondrial fission ELM1 family protein [Pseudomonadota bacterium]